jgi:hypothetical protein
MTLADLGPLFQAPPPPPKPSSRYQRFLEFHAANPHVYERLRDLALYVKRQGKKVGIRLLWERLRWDLEVEVDRLEEGPRLNDHFPPFYARKLMAEVPQLAGFFETRGDA